MIRSLRKRHRRTFLVLAAVLLLILLWALSSRPDWPQTDVGAARAVEIATTRMCTGSAAACIHSIPAAV